MGLLRIMENAPILLVEDNLDDEALTLRAFKKHNVVDIMVVRDGVEALDYLFGQGEYSERDCTTLPRLVLLDLKLPRMDGREVLKKIRADARTRMLPVVVLTSSNEDQDLSKTYDLGANSYVRKPVDYIEFVEVTRILASYWLRINIPPRNCN